MPDIRIADIGNPGEIVLPPDLADALQVQPGDIIEVIQTAAGVELRRQHNREAQQMEHVQRIMNEDDEVLRRLADQVEVAEHVIDKRRAVLHKLAE